MIHCATIRRKGKENRDRYTGSYNLKFTEILFVYFIIEYISNFIIRTYLFFFDTLQTLFKQISNNFWFEK